MAKDKKDQPSGGTPSQYIKYNEDGTINSDYMLEWGRFCAARWNPTLTPLQTGAAVGAQYPVPLGWAQNAMINTSYWLGRQNNVFYNWMFIDYNNKPISAMLRPGQKIYVRMRNIQGNICEQFDKLDEMVYVKGVSNDVLDSKESDINVGKWKLDLSESFDRLEKLGLVFNSFGETNIQTEQDLVRLEETAQEAMEEIFTWTVVDFLYRIQYKKFIRKSTSYSLPTWYGRAEVYVDDFRNICVKTHRPYQCVWDYSRDDENGDEDTYAAVFDLYTPAELISKYEGTSEPFNATEKQEIMALANTGIYGDITVRTLNAGFLNGFMWWDNTVNAKSVAGIDFQVQAIDKDGKLCWIKASLYGNKYIKNIGKLNYQYEKKDNPKKLQPYYIDWRPDIQYGISIGPVERCRHLQERRDMLQAKIDQRINQSLGNVLILDGSQFPDNKQTPHIVSELKQMGATTINRKNINDSALVQKGNFIDVADLGVDPGELVQLRAEVAAIDAEMEEITSVTNLALGTQRGEVGKGVQERSLAQSTYGLVPVYQSYSDWIEQILQRVIELARDLYTQEAEKRRLRISPRQFRLVQYLKEYSTADLSLWVKRSDMADEAQKQMIWDNLFNLSQNPQVTGITMVDVIKTAQIKTMTGLENYYEAKEIKNNRLAREAQEAEMAKEKEAQEKQSLAQLANTEMIEKGATERKDKEIEAGLVETIIKESNK